MVPQERTSDVLIRILQATDRPRLTVGEFIDQLGERAFGILILLFALPNCVPGPPGLATITGIPVIFVAWQMMVGRTKPWLPGFVARRSFPREDMLRIALKSQPWLRRVERLSRPRMTWLMEGRFERALGVFLFILSIVLAAPIPFGNLFPAVAICIIAVAIMELDGATLIVGYVLGALAFAVAMTVLFTILAVIGGAVGQVAT